MKTKIDKKYEKVYTNKIIRNWWLKLAEGDRRRMVRAYFVGGNSEEINTLYGIMPEEMEEIYNQNLKIQEVKDSFDRDSVRSIISELFSSYSLKERENALIEFEINY